MSEIFAAIFKGPLDKIYNIKISPEFALFSRKRIQNKNKLNLCVSSCSRLIKSYKSAIDRERQN